MVRRFGLALVLLAVVSSVAAAHPLYLGLHHPPQLHTVMAPVLSRTSDGAPPWWVSLVNVAMSALLLFGLAPGIIAQQKGMPNWKSFFWRGLIFGFFFFPFTFVLLYKVLKYDASPVTRQAASRPPNVVQPAGQPGAKPG